MDVIKRPWTHTAHTHIYIYIHILNALKTWLDHLKGIIVDLLVWIYLHTHIYIYLTLNTHHLLYLLRVKKLKSLLLPIGDFTTHIRIHTNMHWYTYIQILKTCCYMRSYLRCLRNRNAVSCMQCMCVCVCTKAMLLSSDQQRVLLDRLTWYSCNCYKRILYQYTFKHIYVCMYA